MVVLECVSLAASDSVVTERAEVVFGFLLDFLAFLRLAFFLLPFNLLVDLAGLSFLIVGRSLGGSKAEDHELASSGSSS